MIFEPSFRINKPRAADSKATTTKSSGKSCYNIREEITKWLILITDDKLGHRKHRELALHFLGAADSTLVRLEYRTLILQLHPDKNPSDTLAKQRSQVVGCARDMFR